MTSIKRIVASLAVGAGLMLPAAMGANAAPVNATAQKELGVSHGASGQVELIRRRHHGGKHHGGKHHGGYHRGYRGFYWGAPFLAAPFFYGGDYYDDYPYSYGYSSGYGNSCYRECREFHGPRYCRAYWRRYC